jgi:hypothetical protein
MDNTIRSVLRNECGRPHQKVEGANRKIEMSKSIEKWFLFQYVDGSLTPLSKPFKSKQLAEKARSKYPERERNKIGVGVIRG